MALRWIETDKGDPRCRELADRHYTRIKIGHPMWTRPGWAFVLYAEQASKTARSAVFVWWRPKWEANLPGTERKDGLRCIECTIFRNETRYRSSDLIIEALACLPSWEHATDVAWPDGIISGVSSEKTAGGATRRPRGRLLLSTGRLCGLRPPGQEYAGGRVAALRRAGTGRAGVPTADRAGEVRSADRQARRARAEDRETGRAGNTKGSVA